MAKSYWSHGDVGEFKQWLVPYLSEQLGIGEEDTPFSLNVREYDDFLRLRVGREGEDKPLLLDVAPGPMTPWGRSIVQPTVRTGGKYARIFGPEVFIGGDQPKDWYARTPKEAFATYLQDVWGVSGGTIGGRWAYITGKGAETSVGSLQQYGPVHDAVAQFEMASRVSVGFAAGVRDHAKVWRQLHQWAKGGQDPYFKQLRGYAPWKGDDNVTRLRNLAASGAVYDTGDFDWEVFAFGKKAASAVKHASVAFMGGLRETADLMRPAEGGGLEVAQPGLITGMKDRAGYQLMNLVLSGQSQAQAAVVRPGTAVLPATPFPGAMISYKDVLAEQGIYGAFRGGRTTEKLITPHIRDLAHAEFEFGMFRSRRLKGGGVEYTKEGPLEGAIIPAGQTQVIGTYSYMREGNRITQPIQVTAEGREIAFTEGVRPKLVLPTGFVETETGGIGHPGVFSDEEFMQIASGRLPYVELANKESEYYDPRFMKAMRKAFPGEIATTGQEQPYIDIDKYTRVGFGAKSAGIKASIQPAVAPTGTSIPRNVMVGGQSRVLNAVLGEVKNPLSQFGWMMGSLPGRSVAQSLTELFPEAPGMGRYALEQARAQEALAERVRLGEVSIEDARSRWAGISQEELANIYSEATGKPTGAWPLTEMWRSRFMQGAQAQPEHFMKSYDYAIEKAGQWLTMGAVTPDEQEVYRQQFYRSIKAMGIEGGQADDLFSQYYRFTPIKGKGDMSWWQVKSPMVYQTLTTPVVPEDLWKGVRLGYEEVSAVNFAFGSGSLSKKGMSIAEYMGLAIDQGPGATGFIPPHARAWRQLGQLYAYQQGIGAKTTQQAAPPDSYMLTELQAEKLSAALVPDMTMDQYQAVLQEVVPEAAGAGLLQHPVTKQLIHQPRIQQAITEYEGAGEDIRAVSRSGKQYYNMLLQWSSGGDYTSGAMGRFAADLAQVAKYSGGKTLSKTLGGRWLREAIGGRFISATGMGLGTAVLSQERMDYMLSEVAHRAGQDPLAWVTTKDKSGKVTDRTRWLDIARQQVEEWGAVPGVFMGEPIYGRKSAAIAVNLITPNIMRQRGMRYPEASRIFKGQVQMGSTETGGLVGAFGPEIERIFRDLDLDPVIAAGILKATPRGLARPDMGSDMMKEWTRQVEKVGAEWTKETEDIISMITGGLTAGKGAVGRAHASSGYLSAVQDLLEGTMSPEQAQSLMQNLSPDEAAAMGFENWLMQPGLKRMTTEELWQAGTGWVKGKGGMGVAFNMRRMVESSMSALGFTEEEIGLAHTYGGRSYATYLEQTGTEGGRHLETFMNSLMATIGKGPADQPGMMMMAKPRTNVRHKELGYRMDRYFARELMETTLADESVLPQYAAALFARPGTGEFQGMMKRIEAGEPLRDILEQQIERKGFDIGETPIGLTAATRLATSLTGELSGRPYRMIIQGEKNRVPALPTLGGEQIRFRGEDINLEAFTQREIIERTSALYQSTSGQGGVLRVEQQANLARMIESGESTSPQARYMYQQYQMGEAEVAMRMAEAEKIPFTDWKSLKRTPTIRPHALGFAAFGPSNAMEQKWAFETQAQQIARDVFQVPQNVIQRMFPTTASQQRGIDFEAGAAQEVVSKYGLAYAAGGGRGTFQMQTSYGVPASFKPDIMGVVPADIAQGGKPQFMITDIKHTDREGYDPSQDPKYQLQVSAYAKFMKEAAEKMNPAQFQKFVTPFMETGGIAAKDIPGAAKSWQSAIKEGGIITGIAAGTGGKLFSPDTPMQPFVWDEPYMMEALQLGVTEMGKWYSQEQIGQMAPWIMGMVRGSQSMSRMPTHVRSLLEQVIGDRPTPAVRRRKGVLQYDIPEGAGPSGGTPRRGAGRGGAGDGGDGGGVPFMPMMDPEDPNFGRFWGAIGSAMLQGIGGEGGEIPLSIRHIYGGGRKRADIMKWQEMEKGLAAVTGITGVADDFFDPLRRVPNITFDPRMSGGRFREEGNIVSEEYVRNAIGYQRPAELDAIEDRISSTRQRIRQARSRGESSRVGGLTTSLRRLEGQRSSIINRALGAAVTAEGTGTTTPVQELTEQTYTAASAALGVPVEQLKEIGIGATVGQWSKRDFESFQQFLSGKKGVVTEGSKALGSIQKLIDLAKWDPQVADELQARFGDTWEAELSALAMGTGQAGQGMVTARALESRGRETGAMRVGKSYTPMSPEGIKEVEENLNKMSAALDKSTKMVEENTEARKKDIKSFQEGAVAERQIARRFRAPQLAEARDWVERYARGEMPDVTQEEAQGRFAEYEDLAGKERRDLEAISRLRESMQPSRTQLGRLTRRALGGWGLMYMRSLAGLPMGQLGYGYQQSEEYQQRMAQMMGRAGLGTPIYGGPEQAVRWSQIMHGGTTMAAMRGLGAQIPAEARDLMGGAMGGIAGYAGLQFLAMSAGAETALGAGLAAAAPWAIPVGIGLTTLATGMAYRSYPERTIPRFAAAQAGRVDESTWDRAMDTFSGWYSGLWMRPEDRRIGQNIGALAMYQAEFGISPQQAVAQGLPIPDWMGTGRGGTLSAQDRLLIESGIKTPEELGVKPPTPVSELTREQLGMFFQAYADKGAFEGMEEQAAAVMPELYGTTAWNEQNVIRTAEAEYRGYPVRSLAARQVLAYRQEPTRENMGRAIAQQSFYNTQLEEAIQTQGLGIAEALPYGFIGAAGWGDQPESRLNERFAAYQRGPNWEAFQRQVERYRGMRRVGLEYTPDMPSAYAALSQEDKRERLRRDTLGMGAQQLEEQALVAGLGLPAGEVYGQAARSQADQQRISRRLTAELTGQEYGFGTGTLWNFAAQGAQQEVLAQQIAQAAPEMTMLGMNTPFFQQQMMQGTGQFMAVQRQMGFQRQALGITGRDISPLIQRATEQLGVFRGTELFDRAMRMEPVLMTRMAQQGALPNYMAMMDINLQGDVTGMAPMTTSLQVGSQAPAETAALAWGANWQAGGAPGFRQGMVGGLGETWQGRAVPEYMQGVGGLWAGQWMQRQIQYDAARSQAGSQLAMLELQGRYQPLFWNIEDRQRALSHRQSMWGFEMQEQQFAMQGRQFQENRALQSQQMQMQRQWTREDWATQDQMRAMQWGWKQEDFEENVRFMTGRQRKLAERQMERETVMYGMEGDQIDRQRKRQEETWALEDQRFELVKKHFDEQRVLQEENMKKQKEFYEEGKRLQDERIKLQREYWKEMHELQLAAAGAAAGFAEEMRNVQDDMDALAKAEQERQGQLKVAQSSEIDMINSIIDGLNYVSVEGSKVLKSLVGAMGDGDPYTAPPWSGPSGGGGGTGGYSYEQSGGDLLPGREYIVGERGPEKIRMGTIGSVVNQHDLLQSQGYLSRWNDENYISPRGGARQPTVINLYVGNERFARFILDTVKSDLEVA